MAASDTTAGRPIGGSKDRPRWHQLPESVQREVQWISGAGVRSAVNCPGGYSPGFASVLTLATGRRVFAKAIDGVHWPDQTDSYRTEARTAAALPASVPSPPLLGTTEVDGWILLVFAAVPGHVPHEPWRLQELQRTLAAVTTHEAPAHLQSDHPRLGGWQAISADPRLSAQLARDFRSAARKLPLLSQLETYGLEVAKGDDLLVHFDLYPHNILLTADTADTAARADATHAVYFVDWPHARRGTPAVDVIAVLSTAAWHGIDPEPFVATHPLTADLDVQAVDGLLAAHAGFCIAGTLGELPPGMHHIRDYKLGLGRAALSWLDRRLNQRH